MRRVTISPSVSSATVAANLLTVTMRKFDVHSTYYYLQAPQVTPEHEEVG